MSDSFEPAQSREEAILQNMLGASNELEPPQSRVEKLLMMLLQTGGGGGGEGGGGVSPTVTITTITGGHRIKITDVLHPSGQTFDVMDGEDGQDGAQGAQGPAGTDGDDYVLTPQDKADIAELLEPTVTTVSGTTPQIAAADNTIYKCGEVSTLEITSFPATGIFSVIFTSGSTATTLTVPQTLIMPDGFTVEANMRYEINVMDGYAVAQGWAVSAS